MDEKSVLLGFDALLGIWSDVRQHSGLIFKEPNVKVMQCHIPERLPPPLSKPVQFTGGVHKPHAPRHPGRATKFCMVVPNILWVLTMELATCYTAGIFKFWDGTQIFVKFMHHLFTTWKTWLLSVYPYGILFDNTLTSTQDGFGGLVVSMLASGTQVCGFKPGRSCWIFTGVKINKHAFLRRGSKRICPMSQLCGM